MKSVKTPDFRRSLTIAEFSVENWTFQMVLFIADIWCDIVGVYSTNFSHN